MSLVRQTGSIKLNVQDLKKFQYVIYFIKSHLILQDYYQRPIREISIFLLHLPLL